MVDDLTPPTPPPGITGTVDSSGHVVLTWEPSVDDDVRGYRVLFSNRPTGYFAQLTDRARPERYFLDTVTMNTRNEDLYYKVYSEDYAGNYSPESEPVKVSRPDIIPPTEPVVRSVTGTTEAVELVTALSSSDDVVRHHLERRAGGSPTWLLTDSLGTGGLALHTFRDTSGAVGQTYEYRIVATDDAGLTSYSKVFSSQRRDTGLRGEISGFDVRQLTTSRTVGVSWRYPRAADLEGFQLYRAEGDGPLLAYELVTGSSPNLRLAGSTFTYLDRTVTAGQTYTYRLFARHRDGGHSPLTPSLTVDIQ